MCNYIIISHTVHIVWIQVCTACVYNYNNTYCNIVWIQVCTVCVYNYIIITHNVHIVWMGTGVCVCVWYMFEGTVYTCVEV